MEINLKELSRFLVNANKHTYASGTDSNIEPQRPDFEELEFKEGDWELRDSYYGFFRAPGQTIVRLNGVPVWCMSYNGGMVKEFHGDKEFAKKTFEFLKKALMKMNISKPFRGPDRFQEGDYEYVMKVEGDISDFKGTEKIFLKGKPVFIHDFMGGLIVK